MVVPPKEEAVKMPLGDALQTAFAVVVIGGALVYVVIRFWP